MDPTIVDLVAKIMTILLPFVSKGTEEFALKVGDAAYEKAKTILEILKQKWTKDKEATESLIHFEEKPGRYQIVVEDILQEKLAKDHDLAEQIARLLREMGPILEITQQMEEGKDVIGLRAREMRSGRIKVTQDIAKAERVTGAKLDLLG
ncbi:hypothetical protein KSF_085540 [Reticulibacter mediterranei]|uniref:Uncharacterized protein n=1 Tax=Reticulibacter mediterranei TaxID=2778369 RepID=A0A8J3IYR2_9CHLR|nr:hypothetical protein [Reticulibacter mediterranei]GHO98506.1 hypothetical protein KSF_085540 [Reticulibacter mediterranei]